MSSTVVSDLLKTMKDSFGIKLATLSATALTAARTFTLPDRAGALALAGDVQLNALFNGPLDIWQTGTSFTGITGGNTYAADQVSFVLVLSGTWSITRSTDVPTVAQAGKQLNYSLKAECTTTDAVVNAGDAAVLPILVEGFDYALLYQQTQTISFWVKPSVTGTYCLSLRNISTDRSYVVALSLTGGSWQQVTTTITLAPSGGTWNFTTGVGIYLTLTLVSGTTYQTTAGAWQTGNFVATSAQINMAATANSTIYIADVSLIKGTGTAVNDLYGPRLEHARRYYQLVLASTRFNASGAGYQETPVPFMTPMRAAPTAAITTGYHANLAATFPHVLDLAVNGARFSIQSAGVGDTYALADIITLDARL